MRIILFLLLLFFSFRSISQQNYYYNRYWQETKNFKKAEYMGVFLKKGNLYEAKFYYITGELQSEGHYSGNNHDHREGEFVWYYKSGKVRARQSYEHSIPTSNQIGYYESGQKQFENKIEKDTVFYLGLWSQGGDSLLYNGNGKGNIFIPEFNKELTVKVENSKQKEVFEVRNAFGDTIYYIGGNRPEAKEGMKHFQQFLSNKINYPFDAYEKGEEAIVYVSMIVDKQGLLTEFEPYYGGDYKFDESVVKTLRKYPVFNPSMLEGKPVKAKMILPVVFKMR